MRKSTFLLPLFIIFFLISCSTIPYQLPWVYRIDIQQGNIIDQDMIDQLRPNMTKRQVLYILGSPMLVDVFHQNRWDYIYSQDLNDKPKQQQRISLYFENDILSGVQGDYRPSEIAVARVNNETTVDVPKRKEKKTVFGEIVKFFTFSDDDVEVTKNNQNQEKNQLAPDNDNLTEEEEATPEKSESSETKKNNVPETPVKDKATIDEEIKEQAIAETPAESQDSEPLDSDQPQQNNKPDNLSPESELNQAKEESKQKIDVPVPEAIKTEKVVIEEKSAEEIADQEAKAKQELEEKTLNELEELTKPPVLKIPEANAK